MVKFKGETPKQVTETALEKVEATAPIVEHKVTSFLEAKAKQEIHHIVCLPIGKKLRWVAHQYPKSTAKQFVYGKPPFQHTFGVDSTQEPIFEDEKARPVYISILGAFGPGKVNGSIIQPADTDGITITKLENQDSVVHNDAFEQKQMEAILAAGTRNALPNQNPVWMQFLAFGGIPIGIILGVVIAPYLGKALGGGR